MAGRKRTFGDFGPRLSNGSLLYSNKKITKISDIRTIDPTDLDWMVTYTIFLKASGHAKRYIGDTLNVSVGVVSQILADEKVMAKVRLVQADMAKGALEQIKNLQLEMVEIIAEVARRDPDGGIRLRAAESVLDRGGNVKVNKSESKVTKEDLTDKSPFEAMFEKMSGAPIEVQQKAVELFTELEKVVSDATKTKESK